MKRVPQLLILALSILGFSVSAQSPQPVRRNGEPPKQCKIPPEVLEKETVKRVKPVAPAGAPSSGVVSVRVWVDNDGKVVKAEVISGHPLLRKAALKAARQWKLKPTLAENARIICVGDLNFDFSKK